MLKKKKCAILIGILIVAVAIAGSFAVNKAREARQLQETYTAAVDLISAEDYIGARSLLETIEEENYEDTAELIKTCKDGTYAAAVDLISAEDYAGALSLLETIEEENYGDIAELIKLCKAVSYLEQSYYARAYQSVKYLSFSSVSDELAAQLDTVIAEIEAEYDDYCVRKAEEDAAAYAEKVRTGVPFVGMSESDISNTSLGEPSSTVRYDTELIDGKIYTAILYDFYEDSARIFTARCLQGEVVQVWDDRDNPIPSSEDTTSSENATSSSSSKSGKSTASNKTNTDSFDASSYSHPDDFYYDHYDDFYDYEDAEDYWEAHK